MADEFKKLDTEELAAQAYAEMDAEKEPEATETTDKKVDEEVAEAPPADAETEEEKLAETADVAEETEEEKPADEVQAYAEKHKMTVDEAREDLEKTKALVEQYKSDPIEMARALRNKDREYHKLRTEAEKAKPKEPVFKRMSDDQFREWARNSFANPDAKDLDAEGTHRMVSDFRRKYPAKSEYMSDAAIVEDIVEVSLGEYAKIAEKKESEVRTRAQARRDEIMNGISESDRRFLPEVKAMLQHSDDGEIVSGEFDVNDAIFWAKGKRYDADIKAAEERGFKRAQQKPTIAGVKPASTGGSSVVVKKTHSAGLSDAQKERADEMFGHMKLTTEENCKLFRETFEEELKKDKNYL